MGKQLAMLLVGAALAAGVLPSRADEVAPGTVITKENLAAVKEALIPSMQWMVGNGLTIRVIAPKQVPWPSKYKEATEKYASQVKLSPDGRNANEVTSQALADMGGAATFYDCLVEIERAGAS